MRQNLTADELVEHFTLTPRDLALLANKSGPSRLDFAVLLKLFERDLRFPEGLAEVPEAAVAHVAKQVGVAPEAYWECEACDRATQRWISVHRSQGPRHFANRRPPTQRHRKLARSASRRVRTCA